MFSLLKALVKQTWYHFMAPNPDLILRYGKCYVLIIDPSNELGKELAKCFAKRGFNLVLVAKGKKLLNQIK